MLSVAVRTMTESAMIICLAVGVIILLLSCVRVGQIREHKILRQKVKQLGLDQTCQVSASQPSSRAEDNPFPPLHIEEQPSTRPTACPQKLPANIGRGRLCSRRLMLLMDRWIRVRWRLIWGSQCRKNKR